MDDTVDVPREAEADIDGAEAPETETKPRKPRYFCAGARRVDEQTGKKSCNYQDYYKWFTYCPSCHRPYACLAIPKKEKNAEARISLGQETMGLAKPLVRYSTGISELDHVLGGGVVLSKTLLLGASKGSGKSTAMLQACDGFAREGRKAYFASGEMTKEACLDYAIRLGIVNKNIALFGDPQGLDVEKLFEDVMAFGAQLLIIDSMQVSTVADVRGDIGKVSMMEAVTQLVTSFAQTEKRAVIMIGHLQKMGDYGGSEQIQHLVDGLLRMERKYAGHNADGKPIDTMLREFCWDGKSRQSAADLTALVELTDTGVRPPSVKAMRMLMRR
jgi:predicted ATP-dependent serine protease